MNKRTPFQWLLAAAVAGLAGCAQVGPGGPSAALVEAAEREGKVVVYSVTSAVPALLEDFQRLYPKIKLEYVSLDTTPLYERVIKESAAGTTADVVWSSAMDLQIKLVADGYAQSYRSPEAAKLPAWAVWKDQAWGTTFEPIGFVYNKNLLDPAEYPRTRADLIKLTASPKLKGKITAFDPANSGLGYMLMTQDAIASPAFWDTARAMGAAGLFAGTGSGAQFTRLNKGESLVGYNLLISYAKGRIKKDLPNLGYKFPRDTTQALTRVMFIADKAAHPNAARLWVDYMLSKRGQERLAQADLGALRDDVEDDLTPARLGARLGAALKPIPVGPELLTPLQADRRQDFLRQWGTAVGRP